MKKILVCLDGSPRGQRVLEQASVLAKTLGAELVLFQAVGIPVHLPDEAFGMPPSQVEDFLKKRAQGYLEGCGNGLGSDVRCTVRVDVGAPWSTICAAAIDEKVDLIAIGSHGYNAIDRVLGTTAAKVVNHADRSVLVVR